MSTQTKLFILGNGFDLAHGIPTEYINFKTFLIEKCKENGITLFENSLLGPKLVKKCPSLPGRQIHFRDRDGEGHALADYYQEAAVLLWLIENAAKKEKNNIKDWSDFEEVIMKLNYLPLLSSGFEEDEEALSALRETVDDLPGFFSEWVTKIPISDKKPLHLLQKTMDPDTDIALTFNYTETPEKLYNFKQDNICHIHGKRKASIDGTYDQQYLWNFGEDNATLIVGGKEPENLQNDPYLILRSSLVKDTDQQITEHKNFFNRISTGDISQIYSFGYSFSDVDQPYMKKVCEALGDTSAKAWTVFLHNPDDKQRFHSAIRNAGFTGTIQFEQCEKN